MDFMNSTIVQVPIDALMPGVDWASIPNDVIDKAEQTISTTKENQLEELKRYKKTMNAVEANKIKSKYQAYANTHVRPDTAHQCKDTAR